MSFKGIIKNYLFSLFLILIGLGCFMGYWLTGTTIAYDGTLQEQFGLIPLGYLFVFAGIILFIIRFIKLRLKKS